MDKNLYKAIFVYFQKVQRLLLMKHNSEFS